MIEIHGAGGKIGEVSLEGGTVTGSTPAIRDVAGHMLRKHGTPQKAFRALATLDNGYVWAQHPVKVQQHAGVDLADPIPATEGGPVPDDRTAVAMFTAHRLDEAAQQLAHATERLQAARSASGDLRAYHSGHVARHLGNALEAGHLLAANLREHYPEEAAELQAVKEAIGLAKSLTPEIKAATTAHLLETSLHECTHGLRHAQAMTETEPDDVWAFNCDHAQKHLGGAVEHVRKLQDHFRDNYPDVSHWLTELREIASGPEDGAEHARYSGTVGAQLAAPEAISDQAARPRRQ